MVREARVTMRAVTEEVVVVEVVVEEAEEVVEAVTAGTTDKTKTEATVESDRTAVTKGTEVIVGTGNKV